MTKTFSIRPEFVDEIPESLDEGVLYISLPYRVTAHACCCGCKTRVNTPLLPTRWNLIQNNGSVSLYPSVGNSRLRCQSHYWIRDNQVLWAQQLSKYEVAEGRLRDRIAREEYRKYDSNPPVSFRLLSWLKLLWLRISWTWRR